MEPRQSTRVRQLAWIPYLLNDVACDFLAIYHLRIDPDSDDFAGLTGPQFFRYASRLPRYDGAVSSQIQQWRDAREREQPQIPQPPTAGPATEQAARTVEMTPQALMNDPLFSQYIEYG